MRLFIGLLFAIAAGFCGYQLWPDFHPKCFDQICVGALLPELSKYGPEAVSQAERGDADITINLKPTAPLLDLPNFSRVIPPLNERVTRSNLAIYRSATGKVQHLKLVQVYARESVLYSQAGTLTKWLRSMTGVRAPLQQVNWQRKGIWMDNDHIHGIRTLMQIWPGTAGFATLRLDLGYFDSVPEVEK